MAYLSLYRKYRPSGFDGLIGQEQVVRILRNQIKQDRIGHAYLFCGARGTGKTSAAKIFARAVNCLSPIDGSPCGKCEVCQALSQGSNMDILEIDAASNNGIEEIRDLIDRIQYPPVSGRYKVYIVDEVHMLSISAFNALLKTLEEPPKHALFILATTEVHKLPATILSRCMRFDFRLISEEKLAGLIGNIFDDIGLGYEPEAVRLIAKSGEGSCRDSLSVAEMCLSYANGKLTYQDVLEVIGSADIDQIYSFAESILLGNLEDAIQTAEFLLERGKSVPVLNRDLISHFRDLCIVKLTKNGNALLHLPESVFNRFVQTANQTEATKLLYCIDVLARMELELKYTVHPRVLFETAIFRCASPDADYDPQALSVRVDDMERKLKNGLRFAKEPPAQQEVKQPEPQKKVQVQVQTAQPVQTKKAISNAERSWGSIMQSLRDGGNVPLYFVCRELSARAEGAVLYILVKQDQHERLLTLPGNIGLLKELALSEGYEEVRIERVGAGDAPLSGAGDAQKLDELKSLIGDKLEIK
ncbi:MAG: DNA polymerase III subunit gamma/tau [Clostridia bacterium]|nr:DNA polymerase III subunit gamma/tau [Clostridia bacterium]